MVLALMLIWKDPSQLCFDRARIDFHLDPFLIDTF